MIYMVGCRFTDGENPAREAAWNGHYSGEKLDTLLTLDGFTSVQRFLCLHATPAPYIALHTVRDAPGLNDEVVCGFGEWQPCIDHCSGALFTGLDCSPNVPEDSILAVTDDRHTALALTGIEFAWLDSADPDASIPRRALAVLDKADGEDLAEYRATELRLYRPITECRMSVNEVVRT